MAVSRVSVNGDFVALFIWHHAENVSSFDSFPSTIGPLDFSATGNAFFFSKASLTSLGDWQKKKKPKNLTQVMPISG